MNLRRTVVGVALAAIALTATAVPTASGAEAPAHVGRSQPASHTTVGTPHPGPDKSDRPKKGTAEVPTLPSAPLKGLPTLREARQKGLLSQPMTAAGGATTQAFPGDGCTTPPQGWGYHDYLSPGECLTPNTYIAVNIIFNRWYELWVQDDGNVVLYDHNGSPYKAVWQTGTRASHASLWMQRDGNVVLYDGVGNPMWAMGTNGCGGQGAWLRIQTDANLVLYTRDWTPIWARFNGPSSRPC
ncbi:hypothetical protein ACM614_18145 [Streptomyces sp. 12297]